MKNELNEAIAFINRALVAVRTPEKLCREELRENLLQAVNALYDLRERQANEAALK